MPVTAVGSFQAPNIIVAGTSLLGSQDALTIYGSALNASNAFVPIIIGLNSTDVIDYEGTVTSATAGRSVQAQNGDKPRRSFHRC